MITVAILINGRPIAARSAVNRGTHPCPEPASGSPREIRVRD